MNASLYVTEKRYPDRQSRESKHGCSKREAHQACEQDNQRRSFHFAHPKTPRALGVTQRQESILPEPTDYRFWHFSEVVVPMRDVRS